MSTMSDVDVDMQDPGAGLPDEAFSEELVEDVLDEPDADEDQAAEDVSDGSKSLALLFAHEHA